MTTFAPDVARLERILAERQTLTVDLPLMLSDLWQRQDRILEALIGPRRPERQRSDARPLAEWHEDYGDVLWWRFPIEEAPFVGSPLGSDWPGYHTHWTRFVVPTEPEGA